jgi:hypothetical protein
MCSLQLQAAGGSHRAWTFVLQRTPCGAADRALLQTWRDEAGHLGFGARGRLHLCRQDQATTRSTRAVDCLAGSILAAREVGRGRCARRARLRAHRVRCGCVFSRRCSRAGGTWWCGRRAHSRPTRGLAFGVGCGCIGRCALVRLRGRGRVACRITRTLTTGTDEHAADDEGQGGSSAQQ